MAIPGTDEQLWQQLRSGYEPAFVELMRRYHGPLVGYARKLTPDNALAEDAIQDLFIYLWTNAQTLSQTTAVRPYLLASLRRRLVRSMHRDRWLLATAPDDLDTTFLVQFSIEESLIESETQQQQLRQLNHLLNRLPTRQREALYLKFYQNLNNEQIAEVMHIGYQSATNMIHRALVFLRQHWFEEFTPLLLVILFLEKI